MFVLQNRIFSDATGLELEVWHKLGGNTLTIAGSGVNVSDQSSSGYCAYNNSDGGQVIYTYVADQNGFMCVDLNLPKRNNVSIWRNGIELYDESMSLQQMLAVGDVRVGDTVEVRLDCKKGESGTATIGAAILNSQYFRQGYDILRQSVLELTHFSNTLVKGTINCDRDGLLYTSIPQNGNWSVVVDGAQAPIRLVGDAMIAVDLTEGAHQVTFRYENPAFELGWKVSLACFLVFAALVMVIYKPHPNLRHGKFEKK